MDQTQVVVVSSPGRKLENLISMLESINPVKSVTVTESCVDAFKVLDSENPSTIMIDYRTPNDRINHEISELIMNHAVNHVVLLQQRNAEKSHFTHFSTSEVIYDDLSVAMLTSLLRNVALDMQV